MTLKKEKSFIGSKGDECNYNEMLDRLLALEAGGVEAPAGTTLVTRTATAGYITNYNLISDGFEIDKPIIFTSEIKGVKSGTTYAQAYLKRQGGIDQAFMKRWSTDEIADIGTFAQSIGHTVIIPPNYFQQADVDAADISFFISVNGSGGSQTITLMQYQ